MTWNQEETVTAADKAARLSEVLEQEGFYEQGALRWLSYSHWSKFLGALDREESARLLRFASKYHYPDEGDSFGFPLLDWLWPISPGNRLDPQSPRTTDSFGSTGQELVARLAVLDYAWVARWWGWRCEQGRGYRGRGTLSASDVLVNSLTTSELQANLPALSDGMVVAFIGMRPDLIDALPRERRGAFLRAALVKEPPHYSLVEELSRHGIPSDAIAVVDMVLDATGSDAHRYLDELVTKWRGPSGSDPVTAATKLGHERLKEFFRSPWQPPARSSRVRADDKLWEPLLPRPVGRAFAAAACVSPERFRLELGYSTGVLIAGEETEPSPEKVGAHLKRAGIDPPPGMVDLLLPMAELWATLRTFSKYQANSWQRHTELVGLRAKIVSLASAAPDLWAQSLPSILDRASTLDDVAQAVTLELASSSPQVRASLDDACGHHSEEIRLKASGLRTLLLGLEAPDSGLARTLADAAAHYMDGAPVFPHPLEPVSLTWLGSGGVERAIADGVRRAAVRFAGEVRDQGADIEEALTKALVKELEVEFREVRPRLKLLGSSRSRSPAPVLSVRQRPSSKKTEEPVYGCDLAWLLNATVRGRYSLTWVDLIQVKKSSSLQQRGGRTPRADSWKIECKQLDDILKWSPTAAYWLIASGGEVLVVPAKHLLAVRLGARGGASLKTFTVGYHQVRSAAIPLEQYLVDLLIGQWVGTSSEDVVGFARGDNSNIRPRVVIEVTIAVGPDNQ
jgi:hypothetical protein